MSGWFGKKLLNGLGVDATMEFGGTYSLNRPGASFPKGDIVDDGIPLKSFAKLGGATVVVIRELMFDDVAVSNGNLFIGGSLDMNTGFCVCCDTTA